MKMTQKYYPTVKTSFFSDIGHHAYSNKVGKRSPKLPSMLSVATIRDIQEPYRMCDMVSNKTERRKRAKQERRNHESTIV